MRRQMGCRTSQEYRPSAPCTQTITTTNNCWKAYSGAKLQYTASIWPYEESKPLPNSPATWVANTWLISIGGVSRPSSNCTTSVLLMASERRTDIAYRPSKACTAAAPLSSTRPGRLRQGASKRGRHASMAASECRPMDRLARWLITKAIRIRPDTSLMWRNTVWVGIVRWIAFRIQAAPAAAPRAMAFMVLAALV